MNPSAQQIAQAQFLELINDYNEVRSVLMALKEQNGGDLTPAIRNELRALNDHLARCYIPQATPDSRYHELVKADGHLRRAVYDTFKHLNIIYHSRIADYEKRYFGSHWHEIDNGEFYLRYSSCKIEFEDLKHQAKIAESENNPETLDLYLRAFIAQSKVYQLLAVNQNRLELTWCEKLERWFGSHRGWIAWTVLGATVAAIVCKLLGA